VPRRHLPSDLEPAGQDSFFFMKPSAHPDSRSSLSPVSCSTHRNTRQLSTLSCHSFLVSPVPHFYENHRQTVIEIMKFTSLVATGFLVKHSAAAPVASSQHNGTGMCDRGLHIIVARGTLEPGGPGHMGRVAETVAKMIPGSTVSDVDYPASVDYYPSEALGIDALSIMIMEYHNRCPSSRIALMGYSQVCSPLRRFHLVQIANADGAGRPCSRGRALRKVSRSSVQQD